MEGTQQLSNDQILAGIQSKTFEDRAFGCIVGAFVGDACGSKNEFNKEICSEVEMDLCMQMPGGGPFKLAPGQITDDSELAMMMMHGLLDQEMPRELEAGEERKNILVMDNIAKYNREWMKSRPFDIGQTTFTPMNESTKGKTAKWEAIVSKATEKNQNSLSNGSLMRMTPMVIFTADLQNENQIKEAIEKEAGQTHPNQLVKDCQFLYALAIHYLLKNPTDENRAQNAFDLVYKKSAQVASHKNAGIPKTFDASIERCQTSTPREWLDMAIEIEKQA